MSESCGRYEIEFDGFTFTVVFNGEIIRRYNSYNDAVNYCNKH